MNKQYKILPIILILAFITSGCSNFKNNSNKSTKFNRSSKSRVISNNLNSNIDTDIGSQLVSSARSIEKSLATLAAAQEINNIPVLNTAPLITPEGGMGGIADIDWTGPIEPLLEKIASMTDYKLKILGTQPALPIIVSITQSKGIVADILKNACLQVGRRANIIVFPANKIIELRYKFASLTPNNSMNNGNNNG